MSGTSTRLCTRSSAFNSEVPELTNFVRLCDESSQKKVFACWIEILRFGSGSSIPIITGYLSTLEISRDYKD